ncbi:astacin-like metalloendopeptidase isoform X2 [Leucoraja erinacea]|uniref:astacin-like metalloendopeptidase isoform X2 n=1 Tax=Leucoraja erinaceus TaxID=7782 RepID=UPI0024542B23|nr:astacin-like metalloendopeptidase isoform X2 [Leucoraja erinacea]
MEFIFGTAMALTLMSTSWSSSVMVNSSTTQTLQGLFLAQNINPDIYEFQGNLQRKIPDSNEVDIFTKIAEINKRLAKEQQKTIYDAMQEFDDLTCIKFIYRRHQMNYIKIIAGDGCWSNIGYNRRIQVTSLQRYGCTIRGIIQHELLHTIGFNHEQNRSDRDTYVTILFDKIIKEARYNFLKLNTNNLGMPYDYNSVMHYGRYAFSKDGQSSTIVPKPDSQAVIGQRFGLSTLDVNKVNKLYNCNKCGGLLMEDNGLLNSPGFPQLYPNNLNCKWLIRTPDYSNQIFLQFTTFQVEQFTNCYSDHVVIYDGDNSLSHVLDGPNCGAENPAVISSGAALLVEFFTSRSQRAQGFSAKFEFVECGSTKTNKKDEVDFRAWKNDGTELKCVWVLLVPRAFKIVLTLTMVNLDTTQNCENSYLAIYDTAAIPAKPFAKYCESLDAPITFTSTGRTVVIELAHVQANLGWGFSAEYKSIKNKNPPTVITYMSGGNCQNSFAVVPPILLTSAILYFCIFPYF